MKIILVLVVALLLLAGGIYGFSFAMKDAMSMYPRTKKPADDEARRNGLLAELSALDQQIAGLEGLTASECDDATLQRATGLLAEAREIREQVEEKLRTE